MYNAAGTVAGLLSALTIAGVSSVGAPAARASNFTTVYNFTDGADGGNPIGGVIRDSTGTFYGETYRGGTLPCSTEPGSSGGCGTVYSYSAASGLKVLVSFTGANGAHGNSTLLRVRNILYGVTESGGVNNDGVVFSVNMDGTGFTLLHQFAGSDGSNPLALVAGQDGLIYGIAKFGGSNDAGVLFSLAPGGVYKILHKFGLPVSSVPSALLAAGNDMLVGSSLLGGATSSSCQNGCGTLYSYVPSSGKFTTLYILPSSDRQGALPYLGSNGNDRTVYSADSQRVFSLAPGAGFSSLSEFNNYTVGYGTASGPVFTLGGDIYGVVTGGPVNYFGSLYAIKNGIITDANIFTTSAGDTPIAKPTVSPDGSLIGTTSRDGLCAYCGSIWQYTP